MKQDLANFRPRNWKLGFGLALLTAVLWGLLPIALKVALTELDPWTITWCRFSGAMLTMAFFLAVRGQLPKLRVVEGKTRQWLIVGSLGLPETTACTCSA
jgi:drug/metabolite transporter (DMT)-like permease